MRFRRDPEVLLCLNPALAAVPPSYSCGMEEPQTDPDFGSPPGGGAPPAPPGMGQPGDGVNPSDPGPPIRVRLEDHVLGDLGSSRTDARLLSAILVRNGRVGQWLRDRGLEVSDVEETFPGSGW